MNAGFAKEKIPQFLSRIDPLFTKRYRHVRVFNAVIQFIREWSAYHTILIVTSNIEFIVHDVLLRESLDIEVLSADTNLSKTAKLAQLKTRYSTDELWYVCDTSGDILEAKECRHQDNCSDVEYHDRATLALAKPNKIIDRIKFPFE